MNIYNFQASVGWLDRQEKRGNVSFKMVSGEDNTCIDEIAAPWKQRTLPTISSEYKRNQIYSAKEFGLIYCAHPERSFNLKNKNCVRGTHNKLRLTEGTSDKNQITAMREYIVHQSIEHQNAIYRDCVLRSTISELWNFL